MRLILNYPTRFAGVVRRLAGGAPLALALLMGCSGPDRRDADAAGPGGWPLLGFAKADADNPLLGPSPVGRFTDPILQRPVKWEEKDVFNPAAVVKDGQLFLLYRAENRATPAAGKTSRIGLASSPDGIHFTRLAAPVLYPDHDPQQQWEWPGGTEDPRVVQDDRGTYYMTYTAYDGDKARLHVATSPDLRHWTKHGHVFARFAGGRYANTWTKSGAVVARYEADGRVVATKINGKYWMYWGDAQIWLASSDDLIHWTPVEMAGAEKPPVPLRAQARTMPRLKVVLPTRAGKFDSDLVEPGPPAMLTDRGIRLLYNGRNEPAFGDKNLPVGTYSAGQALFDKHDPSKLLQRLDTSFLRPDKPYETTGQVNQVVFLEGLVRFRSKWFLYYGTADSKIAVASRAD